VFFSGTIAQEYDTFWVGLESTRVQVLPKGQVPSSIGISTQRPPLFSSTSKYVPAAQAQVNSRMENSCLNSFYCFVLL
jgi:hypothetical protein